MSPKSLQELDLKEEVLPPLAFDDMPEFGAFAPPPQPGVGYKFQLPDMGASIYETFEDEEGTHLRVVFDRDHALLIQAAPGGKGIGETYQTQLSTKARARGKDKSVKVSDVDYLLKAVSGLTNRPTSLKAYGEALQALSRKVFTADLGYSWICNQARDIYKTIEGASVKQEGVLGCGRKYYQDTRTNKPEQKIGRGADGLYPYEILCSGVQGNPCGATVRAFANLDNLRA